ncbi:MAG: pyrroline-5-carboxylate reductase [Azospirillaceae bacterium]|nr:pyrroline-5-carboxylate reductase [Azospirillaceae bacterium]
MTTLLLVGCGKMGRALLDGWLADGVADRVVVVEPSADAVPDDSRIAAVTNAAVIPVDFRPDVVILAVKPQAMDAVIADYARFTGVCGPAPALVVSIAAGKTLDYLQARLGGATTPVVRVMPNTPAAVGRGMSVLVANAAVDPGRRQLAQRLMQAVGEVAWIEQEPLIDVVTALSGGGPAYVFLLIEVLAKAGEAAGLSGDLAMRLARATVTGSGELAHRSAESAEQLRRNVTSPGGTTLAALQVLMASDGLQPLFDRAIAAATARSRELAQ